MIRRIIYILLAVILILLALFGFRQGFSKLSEVRQLDRLPITPIAALTQGVYALEGDIVQSDTAIITPYSNTPVAYFSYQLEETYTDSDGDQQTRTLESGESATPFILSDQSGRITVQPGFTLSQININAPETYRYSKGDLTYIEHTLKVGDRLQMTGQYDAASAEFLLSHLEDSVPRIVTTQTLAREGGQTLFWLGLIISVAVGALAIGIALMLSGLAVHRFWVFVIVMTLGLMGALASIGVRWVQSDWQHTAQLYSVRAQAALNQPANQLAQEDLFRYYLLIERGAQGWPDRALFEAYASTNLTVPMLPKLSAELIREQTMSGQSSRFEYAWVTYLISGLALLFCISLIWAALAAIRLKRLVEFIPTSKTTGLAYGLAELFGIVQTDDRNSCITSHLNQEECVAYRYRVEERQGSGKDKRWVEIESGEKSTHFWLEDNVGRVCVNPAQANIKFPKKRVNQKGSRRYTEYWLPPLAEVYCLGFAGLDEQQPSSLVLQNSEVIDLLITTEDEQQLILTQGSKGFLLTGFALACGLMAGTVWLAGTGHFAPLDLLTVSFLVPTLLLFITVIMHYNSLVFLRQRVSKTAADIDTLLQKRHDLWPRLLETVKGYLTHEQSLLKAITLARQAPISFQTSTQQASKQLATEEKVVSKLVALAEQYPDLKANKVMQQFTEKMQRTEDELALIRQGYNDSVTLYNTQIEKLPDVFLAKAFGFKAAEVFSRIS